MPTEMKDSKTVSGGIIITIIVTLSLASAVFLQIWYQTSAAPKASEIESFGTVPEFSFTNQHGKKFGLQDLRGKVWACAFVFTSCTSTCPMLTASMTRLQEAMPGSDLFQMVSITVDPEKDTPETLKKYAEGVGARMDQWMFLTGQKEAIKKLAIDGFKLGAEPGTRIGSKDDYDIVHSNRIVLVDRLGNIRGYFDGTLRHEAKRLKRTAQVLLADGR